MSRERTKGWGGEVMNEDTQTNKKTGYPTSKFVLKHRLNYYKHSPGPAALLHLPILDQDSLDESVPAPDELIPENHGQGLSADSLRDLPAHP